MPEFAYKALDTKGRPVEGAVTAVDRAAAITELVTQGAYVTDLGPSAALGGSVALDRRASSSLPGRAQNQPVTKQPLAGLRRAGEIGSGRVKPRQRVALLRQLSVGLSAGLTLVNALEVVADQAETAAARHLIDDLVARITSGDALSAALAAHPKVFSKMQISMTQAGEASGSLDSVMTSLAAFDEREQDLRDKLRSAAMYPLMVLGFGGLSILVIMLFILPRILTVVEDGAGSGASLPWPTRVLVGLDGLMRSPAGILAVLVVMVAVVVWWRWAATPEGRLKIDTLKLRLPLIGPALRRVAVSRLARTLGTLAAAGIPVVESLRMVCATMGNEALARDLADAAERIERGGGIADELAASGRFPQLLIQVVAMGERTGRLDELLMSTAESYDKETATALERVISIVPVLLILVLAVFVGFILAAALLPIMGMELGGP